MPKLVLDDHLHVADDFTVLWLIVCIFFSYFSTKAYVVGTQKNRLNEMVLLSTQNICMLRLMDKNIFTMRRCKMLLSKPMTTADDNFRCIFFVTGEGLSLILVS